MLRIASKLHRRVIAALLSGALAAGALGADLDIYSFTLYYIGNVRASEYNVLPTYCRSLVTTAPPGFPKYIETEYDKQMLHGIRGKHHFCNIPVLRQRYVMERDPIKKRGLLQQIVSEADYVIGETTPNAPLRIRAHIEKAAALVSMNRPIPAEREYALAVQLDSRDPTVYLELASFYERYGNRQRAHDVLREGIRNARDPSPLRKRYAELGGTPP